VRVLILLVILLGNIVATPFVNSIQPVVMGMPFFLFWFLIWMIITPLLTAWIYLKDKQSEAKS